jgi:hypothetical protein
MLLSVHFVDREREKYALISYIRRVWPKIVMKK